MNKRQKKKQLKKQEIRRQEKQNSICEKTDRIIEENRMKDIFVCGKTQKLYRKNEEIIDQIIFDQYNFQWKIYYHTDDNQYQKEFCIGAFNDLKISPQTQNKVNIYKRNDIDKNLIYAVSAFDNCHENSTALRDLLTDSLDCKVIYDLSRKPKNFHIANYTLKKVKDGAFSEKKRCNARVIRLRNRIAEAAVVGMALILGIVGIGSSISKKTRSTDDNNKKMVTTEMTTEESLTEVEKIANTTIEEVSKTTTEANTHEQTTEEITTEVTTQEQTTEEVTTEATTQEEIVEEKEEVNVEKINNDIKLKDSFKLENITLVDSTKNPRKKAHTSSLRSDEYKIALTAVLVNKKIVAIDAVEELENLSLKEIESKYKETYGENAQVYVNFNGYKDGNQIYKYIGWGHIDEFKDMKTSENQNNISKLKQIKSKLLSSKSLQKTYKI